MTMTRKIFPGSLLIAVGFALAGCPKAKGPEPKAEAPVETPAAVKAPEVPETPALEVGTQWATAPDFFETVYFDYMKAELTQTGRASLQKNAAVLKTVIKSVPDARVRVEGHCDDRGTLEYNMALGERRAKAVRDYYASLGVSKAVLSTISYGEERPVCTDSDENCWSRNRRGETTIKAGAAVRVPLPR